LRYRDNGRAMAGMVFEWPGMLATFARYVVSLVFSFPLFFSMLWAKYVFETSADLRHSTILLWHSLDYIDTYGPLSKNGRARHVAKVSMDKSPEHGSAKSGITAPEATHARPQSAAHSDVNVNQTVQGV